MSTSPTPPRLMLNDHCRVCEFRGTCLAKAEEADSLTLLEKMTSKLVGLEIFPLDSGTSRASKEP
jgi:predicted RecB family nuclease